MPKYIFTHKNGFSTPPRVYASDHYAVREVENDPAAGWETVERVEDAPRTVIWKAPPPKPKGFLISYIADDGSIFTFGQGSSSAGQPFKTYQEAYSRFCLLFHGYQERGKIIDLSK